MRLTRHKNGPSYRSDKAWKAAKYYAIVERVEKLMRYPHPHRKLRDLIAQACGEEEVNATLSR